MSFFNFKHVVFLGVSRVSQNINFCKSAANLLIYGHLWLMLQLNWSFISSSWSSKNYHILIWVLEGENNKIGRYYAIKPISMEVQFAMYELHI